MAAYPASESRRRRYRALFEAFRSVGDLTERELLLVGAVAYWAEGAKNKPWCRRDRLDVVNSDPDMIRLFLRWLDLLHVDLADIRVSLQIHQSADVAAAEQFWSDIVGIPVERFNKTQLKRHNPKTRRRNTSETYRGCLRVDVHRSAEAYRRMEGLWHGILSGMRTARPEPPPQDASVRSLPGADLRRFRASLSRVV